MLVTPHRLMAPASAGLRPSLDLGFLSGALDSRITFTRASAAWAFNSSGVLTSYAINAPRFDYDPVTLTLKGLLIEEARTNLFLNSAIGVTQSCTVAAAANTLSFYGTGTITLTGVSTAGPLVGTGATTRVSLAFTPTAGSLTLTVSGSVTNVQLELGAFASSPIVTVGATVTRAVDVAKITTLTPWFNAAEGTLFADYTPVGIGGVAGLQTVVYLDDGTNNERMGLRSNGGTLAMLMVDGGVTQSSTTVGTIVGGTAYRHAFTYKLNDLAGCQNGGTVATDTSATIPTVTTLLIGSRAVGPDLISAHYRSVRYYNSRLPDATLQRITA